MAEIFLSYAEQGSEVAAQLEIAFRRSGVAIAPAHSPGQSAGIKRVARELTVAKCVVVLWSDRAAHQISSATLQIRQGSLYPAIHRLERKGWIKAEWRVSDQGRRAKYYALTRRGRAQLDEQVASWRRLSATIGQVLDAV